MIGFSWLEDLPKKLMIRKCNHQYNLRTIVTISVLLQPAWISPCSGGSGGKLHQAHTRGVHKSSEGFTEHSKITLLKSVPYRSSGTLEASLCWEVFSSLLWFTVEYCGNYTVH